MPQSAADAVAGQLVSGDVAQVGEALWEVDPSLLGEVAAGMLPAGSAVEIDAGGFVLDEFGLGHAPGVLTTPDGLVWDVEFVFGWDGDDGRWRVVSTTEPVER